jgi:hypothetical protein
LVEVSKKLATGKFDKIINPNYFKNLAANITSYINILKTIESSDADYDNVSDMADSMVELAKAYDRLGEAVMNLNSQVGGIDTEKMTVLKNLAGSVVMLSLMDSTQFGSMMDELESKAGIFLDVMGDTKESTMKEKAPPSPQPTPSKPTSTSAPKPTGGSTAAVKTQAVSSPKPEKSENEKLMSEISKSLAQLSISMAQIQSVVGGPLRTYINTKLTSNKGNDFTLSQKD